MKRILKSVITASIIGITFSSLQSCKSVKPIERAQLEGDWILWELNNENATDVFKGMIPNLKFDLKENTISGNGGCNTYSGTFTLSKKNEFYAPNVVSTMKACIEDNKEPQYFKNLSDPGLVLSIKDDMLYFSKKNNIILQFSKSADMTNSDGNIIAKRLIGSWVLNSISDGDIDALFSTQKPTMEITDDGKITGNAGCNTYRTSYSLDGNIISFTPVISTKMACPSLEGESLFVSHLQSPLQVVVNKDKINLYKDNIMVLEFIKNTESK